MPLNKNVGAIPVRRRFAFIFKFQSYMRNTVLKQLFADFLFDFRMRGICYNVYGCTIVMFVDTSDVNMVYFNYTADLSKLLFKLCYINTIGTFMNKSPWLK